MPVIKPSRLANDEVLILPQIETHEALANLEAVLDVEGSAASMSARRVSPSPTG